MSRIHYAEMTIPNALLIIVDLMEIYDHFNELKCDKAVNCFKMQFCGMDIYDKTCLLA